MRPPALLLLASALASAQPPAEFDLLLRGGHVIDPANGIGRVSDVAVTGARIARVADSIPVSSAKRVVNAAGLYVIPGMIDLHAHAYGTKGALSQDDTALPTGVTTAVDCGGAGWRTFEDFKQVVIDRSATRILVFLNIVGAGMVGSEDNVEDMDPVATAKKIRQYPGLIVGIKNAHFGPPGWESVRRAVEAGRLSNTPVILDNHIQTRTQRHTREKLLEILRPGDMHTHFYNDRQVEVIDRFTSKVQPWMFEARQRGVLFDMGHGAGSFLWPVASKAMEQGFPPDTISTDLHKQSIMGTRSDMPNCISKMMLLGMTLQDAVLRSTANPAKAISKYPELGTLGEGRGADIAVLRLETGVFAFRDALNKKRMGRQRLVNVLTVRDGRIVWDRDGIAFPDWRKAGDYEVLQ
ncbi:MAG: amidohydrolase/deacetylase family metallohydrolase [Bryobacterales bacterium]|nr:amidohydrolase/deacetylase family metallohydrolase [Bryobacterales bacterium]